MDHTHDINRIYYKEDYESPLGKILLAATKEGLTGLWFYEQKYFAEGLKENLEEAMQRSIDTGMDTSINTSIDTGMDISINTSMEISVNTSTGIPEEVREILATTKRWLDAYFAGESAGVELPVLSLEGTDFQIKVWKELLSIPYGCTTTYGEIAKHIAAQEGKDHMSAQAVGSAVGHNKISLLVPCHRVIGKDGSLTGYAGGIHRKRWLLELEQKGRKHGEEL